MTPSRSRKTARLWWRWPVERPVGVSALTVLLSAWYLKIIYPAPSFPRSNAANLLGALPFSLLSFQFGMGNEKMPNDRLEGFRMWGDVLRIHCWNNTARVSHFGSVSAVSSHDAQNG